MEAESSGSLRELAVIWRQRLADDSRNTGRPHDIPGLAVLYGGLVQKKWAVNTMMMVFSRSAWC